MERENSWVSHCFRNIPENNNLDSDSFSDLNDEENDEEVSGVPLDLILPDDLLERILTYLPIASIFRAKSVCKRWNEIVTSRRFLRNNSSHMLARKPWYFMFTSSDEPMGYSYDPILRKWYNIDLPCIDTANLFISSSCGLVCFMDKDSRSPDLYVCNPITKFCKGVDGPPGPKCPDYSTMAVSVDRASLNYEVSIIKCKEIPGNYFQWDLSIHVYDSESMMWTTPLTETMTGWRAGDESVICDGVLYFLIYSAGGHGLLAYNLKARSPRGLLARGFLPAPCTLTCGRLMNLRGRLFLVGGIGKHNRADIIKGIGVWALNGPVWEEIARVPHKYFQGFGELDDVFASGGMDDLIYIHSYGSPALLVFDVGVRQWRWGQKSPVTKKSPLQLFTGFCFEPSPEIAP